MSISGGACQVKVMTVGLCALPVGKRGATEGAAMIEKLSVITHILVFYYILCVLPASDVVKFMSIENGPMPPLVTAATLK